MASFELSLGPLDSFYSNKSNFSTSPRHFPVNCTLLSISSCIHQITSLSRLSAVKFSRIQTQVSENDPCLLPAEGLVNGYLIEQKHLDFKRERKRGAKKAIKRKVGFKFKYKMDVTKQEREDLFMDGEELGAIRSNLSLEQCNDILKQLERCHSDSKALRFFEWMKSTGKLEKNINAYNVIFRVLGRREAWDTAERMIREMIDCFGSEQDCRIFNTLIYSCSKRGNVELSGKWFRMMLELGVLPNVATFGMLMGLYQKGSNVEEAEFAFAQMRSFGIICQSGYSAMITIYTRLSLYDMAEKVIDLMREDKVVLNLENWLVLLNAYSQQGKMEKAEQVFVSMQEAKFSPNIVAYNMLITGYGKVSNMAAAERLFLGIQKSGLQPDETTYRSMIEGWGRAGNHKKVEWCYKKLKHLGLKPNSSNLFTLINLQAAHGDEEGACRILDDMLKMGCQYSSMLGTLLKAYEKVGRIDKIPLILKGSLLYHHILVNQNSCSILVIAFVKNLLVDEAIKVLGHKEWNDQVFEANLYHLLICTCKELGHLENAIKIYTWMPKFDDRPNLHISCTMIDIYSSMGQFIEGEQLYLKLKSSRITLDMIAFSIVVRMYVKAGSLKGACSVLETMEKEKGIVPDIYLFHDMLRIYQQCGMMDKLKNLYYKILKCRVVWDQELYNCIINCCARALPVDELSKLFNGMLQCGFAPSSITFNVMLDVYAKAKVFDKAWELFMMARKQGLADVITYNTIIAAYGHNKDFKNMASTLQIMQFDGFSISLEAYNCMLDAYGKEGQMESFREVLQRMKKSSCAADNYTYNIMMNIYGEQGWIDEVAGVLTELRECGPELDLCSYNTLIKAYGIAGMVEDAVGLVKAMRQNGIEPDKITYTNLISALQRNDEFLEAVKWSLWMKQVELRSNEN